jgi:hypothetical protein
MGNKSFLMVCSPFHIGKYYYNINPIHSMYKEKKGLAGANPFD